jgi:predicted RNase H-like HicB family nuclease
MAREFTVIIEQDEEGYYVATAPQLHGCHTQARSLDELMVRIKEAIELCLEVEAEVERDLLPLQLVGVQRVAV